MNRVADRGQHVNRDPPVKGVPLENRIQMVTCRSSMLRRRACTR